MSVRMNPETLKELRERGINLGPYVRALADLALKGKIPVELKTVESEGMEKWKHVRIRIRI